MIDFTDTKIGRLKVLGLDVERNEEEKQRKKNGEIKTAHKFYKCECRCGNIISVNASNLKNGNVSSCGCFRKECVSNRSAKYNEYEFIEELNCYKGWDTRHINFFLISKEDYDWAKEYCWNKNTSDGYLEAYTKDKNKKMSDLHQEIMKRIDNTYEPSREMVPDHINNEYTTDKKDDNRRCNLRLVTRQENTKNRLIGKNNTSGVLGVSYNKNANKWVSQIGNQKGKEYMIKYFNTFEEAVEQRKVWEREFGYMSNDGGGNKNE